MSKQNIDKQAPTRNKEDVRYRQHESCKTCAFFNGRVYCSRVRGHISPEAVCELWSMLEEPERLTGKQIVMREWERIRS